MSDTIHAPFSDEQIAGLNAYQRGPFHPYTCGDMLHRNGVVKGDDILVAKIDGWQCPTCGWRQTWAHNYMPDFLKHLADLQMEEVQDARLEQWQANTLPVDVFGETRPKTKGEAYER